MNASAKRLIGWFIVELGGPELASVRSGLFRKKTEH
jgi:hypothetical protein